MTEVLSDLRTPTAFEARLDAVSIRLSHLAEVGAHYTIGKELEILADELRRLLRDYSNMNEPERSEIATRDRPTPTRRGQAPASRQNLQTSNAHRSSSKNRGGERHCQRHNGGKGAWLPQSAFDVKVKETGQLKTWCRACYKDYQRERYVRIGFKVVTAEVLEGDACVGHKCPECGLPFEAGQRVQADHLRHEECP